MSKNNRNHHKMNNIKKKLRNLILWIVIVAPITATAQSLVDTVPYCCDFENAAERLYWRFANTTTSNASKWMIGMGNQTGVGVYSLYISSDNASNSYSNVTSYSYAYRKIHIPAGIYEVSYDWVANGYYSTNYAYMRAFLIPATATFSGGTLYSGLSGTTLPAGAISVDGNTARLLQPVWTSFLDPIVQVPTTNDYYLVFFWFNNTSSGSSYQPPAAIDNICINPVTCPQPYNVTKNNLGNGCVEVSWTDFGTPRPTGWIVEYWQYGSTSGNSNKHYTTTNPDTICGLQDNVTYEICVRAICPNGDTSNCSQVIRVRYCTVVQGCIDFTNLTGPNCVCSHGTTPSSTLPPTGGWGNTGPYATTGIVDHGPRAYGYPSTQTPSQHTVHTDPSMMDSLSNNQLPTIPPTECASVRLGCARAPRSYEASAITYNFIVDTTQADIIVLKYALVTYNPAGHNNNQQPRFTMQLVDNNNIPIDPICGVADFVSSQAASTADQPGSPWHSGRGSNIFYRDWTTVGLDVSRFHGQNIRVSLATFTCTQGATDHTCYAYFTLSCSKARIIANTCGGHAQTATLTAPSGFNYNWYNPSIPGWSSNQQTVQVNIDSSVYYCEVSFVDNPQCRFTMSTMAAPRFPHARFSASLDTAGCNYTVNVTNTSYASISATDPNPLGPCESFFWDWGDGTTSRAEHPQSHTYRQPGTYTIMFVVGLADGECTDTTYQTITFHAPEAPTISGDSVVCINTRAHIQVNSATARRWQWSNGQTTSGIDIYPPDSVTMTVHVWDQLGCETVLDFHVDVDTVPLPVFDPSVYESCVPYTMSVVDINPESQGNTYSWNWGDGSTTPNNNTPTHTYNTDGTYRFTTYIVSAEGCLDTVYNTAYVYGFPHGSFSWTPPIITVTNPEVQFINLTTPNAPTNVYTWEVFYHTSNPVRYENTFEPTHRWTGSTTEFSGSNLVRLITVNKVQTISGRYVSCVDTVENTVLVINDLLQFPNTVTPNGDGINDIFEIKNLIEGGGFTDNELYIYNHWGRKVYHKANITTREDFWDPSANNDPDGTYYYRFSAKGYLGDILRNGTITVVR